MPLSQRHIAVLLVSALGCAEGSGLPDEPDNDAEPAKFPDLPETPVDDVPTFPLVDRGGDSSPADASLAGDAGRTDGGVGDRGAVVADQPVTDVPPVMDVPLAMDVPPVMDVPPAMDVPVDRGPSCTAPMALCGGSCVDTRASALHCGRCDNPCAAGATCTGGTCVGPIPTGPDPGRACAANADCGPGDCLSAANGWSAGYCTNPCRSDADCGPTGTCYSEGAITLCIHTCTSHADCRAGYQCIALLRGGGCFPRCSASPAARCGANRCNPITDLCESNCSSTAACSTNSTCSGGTCRCTATTDCGANRTCTRGFCGCANDAACAPFGRCNLATGGCV